MNIERVDTGELTATLKVKLENADYTPGVETALKEQRKTASMPGFRPGQVPMGLIRKRVGKAVLVNEVERLIGEGLNDYIRTNGLRVLGRPLPKEQEGTKNDWDSPGEFEFAYELGLAPELNVELSRTAELPYPVVDVDDTLLQREIENMQRRYGSLHAAEVSSEKDMVLGDMIELDDQGNIKEGGIMNRATISLEFLKDEAARAALVGKSKGDEVRVDPHKVSSGHEDLARMLGVEHEQVHDLKNDFLFRVDEVKKMEPMPVGQEMFDRVFGPGTVSDEADFRLKLKERLEGMFQRDSDRIFKRTVMSKLLKDLNIALPDAFLQRWILDSSEEPMTPEDVEVGYREYAEGLKRQLLEDRIVEKYGLEAKGEEMDGFAKRYVADQFAQYGLPAPEGEELQRMAARMMGDQEQIKRMRDSIVEQKLMVHFRTLLEPKEKKMSYEEFVNLARSA